MIYFKELSSMTNSIVQFKVLQEFLWNFVKPFQRTNPGQSTENGC